MKRAGGSKILYETCASDLCASVRVLFYVMTRLAIRRSCGATVPQTGRSPRRTARGLSLGWTRLVIADTSVKICPQKVETVALKRSTCVMYAYKYAHHSLQKYT